MNKLILPLTVVSVLVLFNAYSSFAQSKTERTEQLNKQSVKQQNSNIELNKACCKSEKAKPDNCCACCTGSTCAASSNHCCG